MFLRQRETWPPLHDDRGRAVPLFTRTRKPEPSESPSDPSSDVGPATEVVLEVFKHEDRHRRIERSDWPWIIVPGVLTIASIFGTQQGLVPGWTIVVCLCALHWPLIWRLERRRIRAFPHRLRAALIGHGRCPACGVVLPLDRRDHEGLVSCERCGAAWRAAASQ